MFIAMAASRPLVGFVGRRPVIDFKVAYNA